MKKIISVMLALMLVIISISAFSVFAINDSNYDMQKSLYTEKQAVENENITINEENLVYQNEIITFINNTISETVFGGLFIDDNNRINVNVTDLKDGSVDVINSKYNNEIVFNEVKYTIDYLEKIHSSLNSYMKEYDIATIDANEVTNTIDIELYNENQSAYNYLRDTIDDDHINISVIPEDTVICFSVEKCDESEEIPKDFSMSPKSGSTMTLYPGAKIYKDGYGYTSGPKYSASTFKTAGHAASYGSGTAFYIPISGVNKKVGTKQSYSLGLVEIT